MASPIEIVQDMYAAFGRGDIDRVMFHIANDAEWTAEGPSEMVFTGARHGKEATKGFFDGIAQEHGDPKLVMTEFVAQGDSVASFGRYDATLKRSGKRISSPVAHLFKFRGDKVAHYQNFLNTAAFVSAPSAASGVVVSFTPLSLTAESYAEVLRRLNQVTTLPPAGGIFHVCYGEPGNLRVTDVFDSMESFEAFAKVLRPIIDALGIHAGAPEIKPVHSAGPWPH